jgi:cytochrome c5
MKHLMTAAVLALAALVPMVTGHAQDVALDPVIAKWDKGPDKIDASKYSADMKQRYKTFAEVCSKCHTLARAVNCDFVLEDDWERYIKKMMRRGRGLISPEQGLAVFEFAIYDAKIRKRELYEQRLAGIK